jgi:hypothetical protein
VKCIHVHMSSIRELICLCLCRRGCCDASSSWCCIIVSRPCPPPPTPLRHRALLGCWTLAASAAKAMMPQLLPHMEAASMMARRLPARGGRSAWPVKAPNDRSLRCTLVSAKGADSKKTKAWCFRLQRRLHKKEPKTKEGDQKGGSFDMARRQEADE